MPGRLSRIPRVALADVGRWKCSNGTFDFTPEMFDSIVRASKDPGMPTPAVKPGHNDPRFDGEPAVGIVLDLDYDPETGRLYGDFEGLDPELAEILPFRYPDRSIEVCYNLTSPETGETYPYVVTGLALLGAEDGAVDSLPGLPLPAQFQGATKIAARKGRAILSHDESVIAAGAAITRSESRPIPTIQRGGNMDPKQIRADLGLPEDATDQQVSERLAQARQALESQGAGDGEGVGGEGVGGEPNPGETNPAPTAEPTQQPPAPGSEGPQAAAGTVTLDRETYERLVSGAEMGIAARKQQLDAKRDSTIEAAIKAGKFSPARKEHWRRAWDADAEGTRAEIDKLAPGRIPVDEIGIAAGAQDTDKADHARIMASFGYATKEG